MWYNTVHGNYLVTNRTRLYWRSDCPSQPGDDGITTHHSPRSDSAPINNRASRGVASARRNRESADVGSTVSCGPCRPCRRAATSRASSSKSSISRSVSVALREGARSSILPGANTSDASREYLQVGAPALHEPCGCAIGSVCRTVIILSSCSLLLYACCPLLLLYACCRGPRPLPPPAPPRKCVWTRQTRQGRRPCRARP